MYSMCLVGIQEAESGKDQGAKRTSSEGKVCEATLYRQRHIYATIHHGQSYVWRHNAVKGMYDDILPSKVCMVIYY